MNNRSLWKPVTAACILLVASAGVHHIAGGLETLARYRQSVYPGLPINPETLFYFLRESLETGINRVMTPGYVAGDGVPAIDLYASAAVLAELDRDLPRSGKARYVSGYLKASDDPDARAVEFRYRGDLPFHWFYPKKSFRVKLPDFETFRGLKVFNLVSPTTLSMVSDLVTYRISREQGLLTPQYFPVRVRVNSVDNGLHFFLGQPEETFLRNHRRMPGSIYSGDRHARSGSSFSDLFQGFYDEDGTALLWRDARLWKKVAARNAETAEDERDLKKFVAIVNQADAQAFYQAFLRFFDVERYFRYFAIDTLVGSEHHDYFHNHKFYFDPYRGRYEPVEWDVRFWNSGYPYKDIAFYPLLDQVKRNPVLEYRRDRVAYRMLQTYTADAVGGWVNEAADTVAAELRTDPYRMVPRRHTLFPFEKNAPFSMQDFERSVQNLRSTYALRSRFLQKIYAQTDAVFLIRASGDGSTRLHISVSGNSPLRLDPYQLADEGAEILREHAGSERPIPRGQSELLFPGRRQEAGNFTGRDDENSVAAYGTYKLVPSPLHYTYVIRGAGVHAMKTLQGVNAITGEPVSVPVVEALPDRTRTVSIHPWTLKQASRILQTPVILEGEIRIDSDRIYSEVEPVQIRPGTRFHIAPGCSIVFRARVTAAGSADRPVIFMAQDKRQPWGAVVVHGKSASGSEFRYVDVSGGSLTRQGLVDYPAQFNIHDVNSFTISHSRFADNSSGDDSVHVAYSSGTIEHSRFADSQADALDIDISDVNLDHLIFSNSGNDCLDLMDSRIRISDSVFDGAGDKCVSVGERSEMAATRLQLKRCNTGIAVKDESRVRVDGLVFKHRGSVPIALYRKNPRYRRGGEISGSEVSGINRQDIQVGPYSRESIRLGSR